MRISRIDATPLAIPLAQEFHWAGGAQRGANLVLFAVRTDDGVAGYGESICESPLAVAEVGRLIARQVVVGRSVGDVEAILHSIWTEGRWKTTPQLHQLLAERLTTGVGVETRGGLYALNDAPGHGFDIDEDAVARAHERWQRDGAYNTIESVNL